jgi:hypothetical protein
MDISPLDTETVRYSRNELALELRDAKTVQKRMHVRVVSTRYNHFVKVDEAAVKNIICEKNNSCG